jgi:sugar lactone lactonase YvrE
MKRLFPSLFFVLSLCPACHKKTDYPIVSTFAGNNTMGSVNGPRTKALFSNLMGVAVDEQGNLYVADSRNNLIRKINTQGMVTTLAGSGIAGSADGKGDTASFFYPIGIAVDKHGFVYVADTHNNLIRKISPDGFVTTIAGKRFYPTIPGTDKNEMRLDNPTGIAVDKAGNVYVADWANDLIRKISTDGKMSNFAGNGSRGSKNGMDSSSSFYLPGGIALDSIGNLYVADTYNNMIRKILPGGIVTTLAGKTTKGSANGKGAEASFSHPVGITADKVGNLYVADAGNNMIRKITPEGMVTVYAGSGKRGSVNGRDTTASFYRPYGVAADQNGNLYVADYLNNQIRKISY